MNLTLTLTIFNDLQLFVWFVKQISFEGLQDCWIVGFVLKIHLFGICSIFPGSSIMSSQMDAVLKANFVKVIFLAKSNLMFKLWSSALSEKTCCAREKLRSTDLVFLTKTNLEIKSKWK